MNTITSSDFYSDGKKGFEIVDKARPLLNLYELSLPSTSNSYHIAPRLIGIVCDCIGLGCTIRDLKAAKQHDLSIEHNDQLRKMIQAANQEFAKFVEAMKDEMLKLESSALLKDA